MALQILTALCFGLLLIPPLAPCQPSREQNIITQWADKIGTELWELGQTITKADEIKKRYTIMNVRVKKKDGMQLLRSAVQSVQRMLTRKTDAIQCILAKAESAALDFELNDTSSNFTYSSSRYSEVAGEKMKNELPDAIQQNRNQYRELVLNNDTHFSYIAVNTNYSSVHVPTNIYDRYDTSLEAISWSEELDSVFVQNYKSDPALSWQYFCSSTGILRHFPAMAWDPDKPDSLTYDCRTRSWYIEAATCSKDVVILFDNSGSMYGYANYVARYTVRAILETLSNNDFLNIFSYTYNTSEVVGCFKQLVQATPENLQTFIEAIDSLKPNGTADLTSAFTKAFHLLSEYRVTRECKNSNQGCNQMIMLVTDGVPSNLTEVFSKHNRLENGTYIPVRVFTYLIGKEVTKVNEIKEMACANRGYYVHIHTIDEVQQQVLKYINVIARPLVLQANEHPPTWTHAYVDRNKDENDSNNVALITSVGIPAFDFKINNDNSSYTAELLGVAGTDVPVADIGKLALPYKLGVNGYAFVVSNNGYLLLHPDLRPSYEGTLNINYNSVDLVEVEMIDDDDDDDLVAREFGSNILELRDAMVQGEEGYMANQSIRFHYDNMRRVSRETHDYYYAPIQNTPFSLGLALPQHYGNTWIQVSRQITKNQPDSKIRDLFQGDNWKVHPDWVYCKYHYLEGHEFNSSESELIHFLEKMNDGDWVWSEQYEPDGTHNDTLDSYNCSRKNLDDNAYFCNRDLVELLVYDAKLTSQHFYQHEFNETDLQMFDAFNTTLRFIATMSGLTRWQYILGEDSNDTNKEFGDYHTYAIDETWYKSAILQHKISAESFVFSVPFDAGYSTPDEDITVIASLAIFPRDAGLEAPGSVVGYEFSHAKLLDRFQNITSTHQYADDCDSEQGCLQSCSSDGYYCYVIDGSGYVVLSNEPNDTGRFFGEVDGDVMKNMVDIGVYQKVVIYDLQGVCNQTSSVASISNVLQTPFTMTKHIFSWLLTKVVWLAAEIQLRQLWDACLVFSMSKDDTYDYDVYPYVGHESTDSSTQKSTTGRKYRKNYDAEVEKYFNESKQEKPTTIIYPCDKTVNLFVLQQRSFLDGDSFMEMTDKNASRPFYAALIKHTNMILLVVDILYSPESPKYKIHSDVQMPPGPPCHKKQLANLTRRRLEGCFTDHELESQIVECSSAGRRRATNVIMTAISSLMMVAFLPNFLFEV